MPFSESNAAPGRTVAGIPFDDRHADVILRSSDGVDFRCWKLLLSMSSSVFQTMFSLPQPQEHGGMEHALQVIQMQEGASVLKLLLRLGHPSAILDTPMPELDNLADVFQAANKYEMNGIENFLRTNLASPRSLDTDPARVRHRMLLAT